MIRGSLSGRRFGMLLVEGIEGEDRYSCRCDCGNRTLVYGRNLRDGRTRSCGDHRRHQTLLSEFATYPAMWRTRARAS